jgi:Na+-transporting NADH:ubiquinone oxidoreductase subunit NqrE
VALEERRLLVSAPLNFLAALAVIMAEATLKAVAEVRLAPVVRELWVAWVLRLPILAVVAGVALMVVRQVQRVEYLLAVQEAMVQVEQAAVLEPLVAQAPWRAQRVQALVAVAVLG